MCLLLALEAELKRANMIAVGWAALLLSGSAPAQNTEGNQYVGSKVCRPCHAALWNAFFKNPHFKSIASGKEPPESTGCEGCHGPGQKHVANGGGKATIIVFPELPAGRILDTCLRCHGQTLSRANIRSSQHILNGMACTSCHSIHASETPRALLRKPQMALCYECHADVRAQFSMPFKHRVDEGFMSCTDCHNPHGTFSPTWGMTARPRLVEQVKANEEPCLNCHGEKRGPFVFEHAPVRVDGCEGCHVPHGSTNSRLLRRPVVFTLCLECHTGAGTFGRQANGIVTQTPTHNMADPRYQNCTACHVRIHGSNANVNFMR
jgi:DmsE family decaheme c-type cytochrome